MNLILRYLQYILRALFPELFCTLRRLEAKLDRLLALQSGEFADELIFTTVIDGKTIKGALEMKLTDSQQGILTAEPSKGGKAKPVEAGSVAWNGPPFVALTPSADGLSVTVVAMGTGGDDPGGPNEAFISVSADADLGSGVVTISGKVPIQVVPSQADTLTIKEGAITEQVAAGPAPNPVP
jgi:hypothetical protein